MATTGLGAALRHWRDRVPPQAAGLPAGGRRRAAGLRREELAQPAGISADYVIRLEQGGATNADLRHTAGTYPDDLGLRTLIAELRQRSPASRNCGNRKPWGSTSPPARPSTTRPSAR
jgi:DNA-binding XRE family transcriptional regulator